MTETICLNTNLHCPSCVAELTPHLDGEPTIQGWTVDLDSPSKTLTVVGDHVDPALVRAAVSRAGFQVLGEDSRPSDPAPVPVDSSSETSATYYPLFLLVSFLLVVVGAAEIAAGQWSWERAMQNFMGAFFITFSFFKLLDLRGFATTYQMYDVVARRLPAYAFVYPFIELGLGLAYLSRLAPFATNLVTLVVMSVSAIGVIQSVFRKRRIRCACLGTVFNLPMSTITIVEDLTMILMAGVMLFSGQHS